jgi:iron complex transport system substrate-binding protein
VQPVPFPSSRSLIALVLIVSTALPAAAGPLTIRDDIGQTLHFSTPPKRIVSLAPGVTEILFQLGLSDAIVGVSDFCNYPEAALSKPKVGGIHPNVEAIVALKPDLVVSTGGVAVQESARRFKEFGIPVMGVEADSIEAILDRIVLLGEVTGRRDAATELVARLRRRLDAVIARRSTGPPPRVLYLIDENPYLTVGPKSFLYDALVKSGGRPFETGRHESYPRVGLEPIIGFDPEVIFFTGESDLVPEERIAAWQRWRQITAVKTGRLYAIPRDLVNRPGPRIVDAVEFLASKLQAPHDISSDPP